MPDFAELHAAWRLETNFGEVFVKSNDAAALPMFEAEADGLYRLEKANVIHKKDDQRTRRRTGMPMKIDDEAPLPPGQFELGYYPRFGLFQFATYQRLPNSPFTLQLGGDAIREATLDAAFMRELPRIEQTCDQNCVTTWAQRGLCWSGVRFKDFYERIVQPRLLPAADVRYVVLRADDGYRSYFLLDDILADDVLLVDTLAGQPLGIDHGAPLRLVAPAHYAFRSVKHLTRVEFRRDLKGYRSPALHWWEHPRSRVAREERGILLPGWLYRCIYRPIVWPTIWNMRYFTWLARKRKP